MIKMEEDDDHSDSIGRTLRSLQHEEESRDSPNSSMTSASVHSLVGDQKSPDKTTLRGGSDTESPSRYLHTKATALFRPKSSIPTRLQPTEYGRQCVEAAQSSRLNPYALHEDEHRLLRDRLCHLHVTVYLNIRNGILRLWVRNPSVSVNLEEAVGCAKDARWTRLACFAYEWLVRNGYINFGCVEPPLIPKSTKTKRGNPRRETVVIIGGGVAGLSSARQLMSLFKHYPDHTAPRIIVLEGRGRIGGRIYSHPLSSMRSSSLKPEQRPTAEMGAHIVVGFENGNPLDPILRGQLALDYHSLRDLSTIYDVKGDAVPSNVDTMIQRLYNDVLERSENYRKPKVIKKPVEGDRELVDNARDPPNEESITIRQYEEATEAGTIDLLLPQKKSKRRGAGHKAAKVDKPEEEVDDNMESKKQLSAARAAEEFGFKLRSSTTMEDTLDLDGIALRQNPTLGAVMYEGIEQYQQFLDLKPFALRLLNWHIANLEYANAASVDKLSLGGWDQDGDYEFDGAHAQVVGGYQQLPRALWRFPDTLDVRINKPVKRIWYGPAGRNSKAVINCEDGETIEADRVIFTAPLGVLKEGSIQFEPPLPDWKQDVITRMGFGLLNKLVLVFERPFWDTERDMFGLLRPHRAGNGRKQQDYDAGRGQFYLFWNCIKTSGLPVLIALIAGNAAHEAEVSPDDILVESCISHLRRVFGQDEVPMPLETIVTRWKSDRFARGTYSYVSAETKPSDFDDLAKPIDNLFFAGEATCRTHLATVHGAYMSGQRVANEVLESLIGPIQIPQMLTPTNSQLKAQKDAATIDLTNMETHMVQPQKRKGDPIIPAGTFTRPVKEIDNREQKLKQEHEDLMWVRIYEDLGPPPIRPPKENVNAYLIYSSQHWETVKKQVGAEKGRGRGSNDSVKKIRGTLSKMWKDVGPEEKAVFEGRVKEAKARNDEKIREHEVKAREWDRRTYEVKAIWENEGNTFEAFLAKRRASEERLLAAQRVS
jgi:monoamine oxidase